MTPPAGTIASLHRYPVKSMLGEALAACSLAPSGVVGDRAYAVVDTADGTVASAKHPRRWGGLLGWSARSEPGSRFEVARYRPNVLVETAGDGFAEDAWVGRELALGGARVQVSMLTMRCVMTTLAQGELPEDRGTLRTIARTHRRDIPGLGTWACAGVYADVREGATLRVGDPVLLEGAD